MMDDARCLLPVCHGGREETKFNEIGIKKLISCAKSRGDGDLQAKLQNIIDGGDAASIACYKSCYCSYTSKEKIERVKKAQKRKAEDEGVRTTTRSRTKVADKGVFEYKRDCGEECLPIDDRHPERWDRIRTCMTKERFEEEGKKRREMDADDRRRISFELSKMSHPLENPSLHLYNIANGRFGPPEAEVNVADSVDIGERMAA